MASRKRRRAIRIGVPGLIVGALMFAALWRLGTQRSGDPAATTTERPVPLPPVGTPADVLQATSIGRQALLDDTRVLAAPSARTLWVGDDAVRVFAVLDPDVKRATATPLAEGTRVTLVGLVRRAPAPEVAIRQWGIDAATAEAVRDGGIYLHVTEVQPVAGSR